MNHVLACVGGWCERNRGLLQMLCVAFALALCLNSGAVFATQPASCTGLDLSDGDASANMLGAVHCVLDTVGITTFIVGLVILFIPIFFLMWGFKAGYGLIKQLVSASIRMLRG